MKDSLRRAPPAPAHGQDARPQTPEQPMHGQHPEHPRNRRRTDSLAPFSLSVEQSALGDTSLHFRVRPSGLIALVRGLLLHRPGLVADDARQQSSGYRFGRPAQSLDR